MERIIPRWRLEGDEAEYWANNEGMVTLLPEERCATSRAVVIGRSLEHIRKALNMRAELARKGSE